MKNKTFIQFMKSGTLFPMFRSMRMLPAYYRVVWLASAARHGYLRALANGPKTLDALAPEMAPKPEHRDALESWLGIGISVGELALDTNGYRLKGFMARKLSKIELDAFSAIIEEVATLHHRLIMETPARIKRGDGWSIEDQDGELIARSSRITEPIGFEAVDEVVNTSGKQRLLEIGAGSGVYIRYATEKNPDLTAQGLELQADVAEMANQNLKGWGVNGRAKVDFCDVRQYKADSEYNVVTLQNNIYYFPVDERVELFQHLKSFLKPGGKLLVTTGCQNGSVTIRALDLWSASTEGCGRLPAPEELVGQLKDAGFGQVKKRNLMPGDSYYVFVATA